MKVLLINGSPHKEGNTHIALTEVAKTLEADGIETEIYWIGNHPIPGCIACYKCYETGVCVFNTGAYADLYNKVQEADGYVIGSPVYYAGPAGSLCALLDRLFYSAGRFMAYKPAASVNVCRRGGGATSFDRLNKYFTINNMPVVPSQYWNIVYGRDPGEASLDGEGLQTMRTLGRNMAWMLKCLNGEYVPHPAPEPRQATNFIR